MKAAVNSSDLIDQFNFHTDSRKHQELVQQVDCLESFVESSVSSRRSRASFDSQRWEDRTLSGCRVYPAVPHWDIFMPRVASVPVRPTPSRPLNICRRGQKSRRTLRTAVVSVQNAFVLMRDHYRVVASRFRGRLLH